MSNTYSILFKNGPVDKQKKALPTRPGPIITLPGITYFKAKKIKSPLNEEVTEIETFEKILKKMFLGTDFEDANLVQIRSEHLYIKAEGYENTTFGLNIGMVDAVYEYAGFTLLKHDIPKFIRIPWPNMED